jgi:AcrR family transcriptional regulator
MPRFVDHDERRQEIVRAAMEIVNESGVRGLSLMKVANRLGGSSTYVTHYYPSRQALMEDTANQLIKGWNVRVTEMEQGVESPFDRLRRLLYWLLPLDAKGIDEERVRILMLAERDQLVGAESIFDIFNDRMMQFLREHLEQVIKSEEVEQKALLLRVVTNGVCLSALERPDAWPAAAQKAVVDDTLELLGIKDHQLPKRRPRSRTA